LPPNPSSMTCYTYHHVMFCLLFGTFIAQRTKPPTTPRCHGDLAQLANISSIFTLGSKTGAHRQDGMANGRWNHPRHRLESNAISRSGLELDLTRKTQLRESENSTTSHASPNHENPNHGDLGGAEKNQISGTRATMLTRRWLTTSRVGPYKKSQKRQFMAFNILTNQNAGC
jgi:hypothetical protein